LPGGAKAGAVYLNSAFTASPAAGSLSTSITGTFRGSASFWNSLSDG